MKAREEMPLLRCALGPTGRPFGDGLHSVTASGTDGRKAVITRNWDMAGSTLKKPIRGRKMGVGAIEKALKQLEALRYEDNTYAILEVPNSEFNFIQTLFDEDSITLEFQKSDTEEQYSTTIKDTKKIIEVFRKYNEGNTSWKNNFDWKEVEY